jgi:toxin FitB
VQLVGPTLSLCEVFRRVATQRGEGMALQAIAVMQQGRLVTLDAGLAVMSARLSASLKLPMADSIMLATARVHDAEFWTQDADFEGIEAVRYTPAGSR